MNPKTLTSFPTQITHGTVRSELIAKAMQIKPCHDTKGDKHTHTHTHTRTYKGTHTYTHTHTHTHTDTHTHRHTHTHTKIQ